jgi:hypothetical protein
VIERIVDAWLAEHPEHPALPHLEDQAGAVEGSAAGHDHDHDHGAHDHAAHDHDHVPDAAAATAEPTDPTATDQPTDVPARAG